jgi:hypothetical protein
MSQVPAVTSPVIVMVPLKAKTDPEASKLAESPRAARRFIFITTST